MESISLAFNTFVLGFVIAQFLYVRLLDKASARADSYREMYHEADERADRYFDHWMGKISQSNKG